VIIRHGQLATCIEVTIESCCGRGVQGNQTALAEFGAPDQQNSIWLQVIEPQVERLRDT